MWITQGDQIKNSVMGGTCGTNRYQDRCVQGFGGKLEGERLVRRSRYR